MVEPKPFASAVVVRFGVFQTNLAARELRKHGVRVRLPGQPFCILAMLLEKPGEIVTREEMRQKLWPADTFVDFEHSLNSAIKKLRHALGDSSQNSRYVETVPRVGYRFVAPVERASPPPAQRASALAVSGFADVLSTAEDVPGTRRLPVFLTVVVVLLMGAGGVFFVWSRSRSRPQAPASGTGETHAAATTKSNPSDASSSQSASSPKSAEARELYLKGLYFWNKRTLAGFQQAVECFQRATTLDPGYAAAYAGLANSYTLLTAYSYGSSDLYVPDARRAAMHALELDEHSAEAHTAMALILQNHDWDWQASEKEYRRAIELDPQYATAHHWYAEHLMWLGRFDEALKESDRARQLDPLSLIIATDHGAILYFSRQYDRAIEQLQTVLRRDPHFNRAIGMIANAYIEKGMFAQALTAAEVYRRLNGDGPVVWAWLAYIYGRAGNLEQAQRELEKLERVSLHEQVNPVNMLWARLGVGDKEEALAHLEQAYAGHFSFLTTLKVEPAFDPLRSDPRFQDLLHRVGLADSGTNSRP